MESRAHLLRNNKIDQMIVCSIAGCLSINYSSRKLTLEQIFNYYNLLNFSFHSNRTGLFDREGNSLDLMAFYNTVFLPEVEDLIDQAGDAADFLTTPVRLQRKKSREEGCNITPIPLKFRQSAMNDLFNIGPVKKVKPNEGYRTE